jgi:hypothetical protein
MRHCAFDCGLGCGEDGPPSIQRSQSAGGVGVVEVSRSEREQMAHSIRNDNPLVDGRLTVRLMRRVDCKACDRFQESVYWAIR